MYVAVYFRNIYYRGKYTTVSRKDYYVAVGDAPFKTPMENSVRCKYLLPGASAYSLEEIRHSLAHILPISVINAIDDCIVILRMCTNEPIKCC